MTPVSDEKPGNAAGELLGLDKRQLLIRHIAGDAQAFTELVQHFRGKVYTYLIRCGVSEGARDDLFQEVFLSVHRNASSYKAEFPLNPWFFKLVANTVRAHFRKERVRELAARKVNQVSDEKTLYDSQHQVEAGETADWLEKKIRELPFAQREMLLLCTIKDMEQNDAAKILDIPLNTLKTHMRRVRLQLLESLRIRNAGLKREVL